MKKRIKNKTVIFVVTKINCNQNLKNLVSVSITDKKKYEEREKFVPLHT